MSATCLWCHYICQYIFQFLKEIKLLCFLRITGFSLSFLFVFRLERKNTWFELRDFVSHAPEIWCFCGTNWALAQHTITWHKPIRKRDRGFWLHTLPEHIIICFFFLYNNTANGIKHRHKPILINYIYSLSISSDTFSYCHRILELIRKSKGFREDGDGRKGGLGLFFWDFLLERETKFSLQGVCLSDWIIYMWDWQK